MGGQMPSRSEHGDHGRRRGSGASRRVTPPESRIRGLKRRRFVFPWRGIRRDSASACLTAAGSSSPTLAASSSR